MEPVNTHWRTRASTSLGLLKKNLSSTPAVESACQAVRIRTASESCQTMMGAPRLDRGCGSDLVWLIALQHFLSQIRPDVAVQVNKLRLSSNVDQISGAPKIHFITVDE